MIYLLLKKTEYKNHPIYIRRLDKHFEFLLIFNNNIYSQYITLIPKWLDMFKGDPFSEKDIKDVTAILIGKARELINELSK